MQTRILILAIWIVTASQISQAQHPGGGLENRPRPVENGTPIPVVPATIVSAVKDKSVVLRMAGGETRHFRLAAKPVYVAPDGSTVESPSLRDGMRVLIHTMEEGRETLIDRLFIQK